MILAVFLRSRMLGPLAVAAGLMVFGVAVASAQAPGQVYTGPAAGIGRNGGLDVGSYDTKKAPVQVRVVQGAVLDKAGAPIKGAMVYLQDGKTKQVRSMLAGPDGKFRFIDLSFNKDYQLWAQANDKKSVERPISSMDTKSELTRDLKVE